MGKVNVTTEEIENVLFDHPAVSDCAAIGVPDSAIGETIKAFVVLRSEYKGKVTEGDIINWAKGKMAPYKYPRIVEFCSYIQKTVIGKTDHRALKGKEKKEKI